MTTGVNQPLNKYFWLKRMPNDQLLETAVHMGAVLNACEVLTPEDARPEWFNSLGHDFSWVEQEIEVRRLIGGD